MKPNLIVWLPEMTEKHSNIPQELSFFSLLGYDYSKLPDAVISLVKTRDKVLESVGNTSSKLVHE